MDGLQNHAEVYQEFIALDVEKSTERFVNDEDDNDDLDLDDFDELPDEVIIYHSDVMIRAYGLR